MYEWITITAYPWIKALHVIAVISWMAGMLYLPRLFVYHAAAEVGSQQSETFKVMEWRLMKFIINPAMVVTWLLGLWLAYSGGWFAAGWLHGKLLLVVLMSGVHGTGNIVEGNYILDNRGDGVLIRTSNNFIGEAIGLVISTTSTMRMVFPSEGFREPIGCWRPVMPL